MDADGHRTSFASTKVRRSALQTREGAAKGLPGSRREVSGLAKVSVKVEGSGWETVFERCSAGDGGIGNGC